MKRFHLGLLLTIAALMGGKVGAADQDTILENALSICANLSAGTQAIESALEAQAWVPHKDQTITFFALASQTMAMDFAYRTERSASRGQDLTGPTALFSFIQRNGDFMAASMIGNSGTSMRLPAFSKSENKLSVRGVASGTPHCLLSGPVGLFDTLVTHPLFAPKVSNRFPDQKLRDGADVQLGFIGELEFFATRLNINELLSQSAAAGVPFDQRYEENLIPTVISLGKP